MLKTNKTLLIAALWAALTAGIHIFAGGEEIATPLLQSTLAEVPKLTMYAVWHMASLALLFSAIGLFIGSMPRYADHTRSMVWFIAALWAGFGLAFLAIAAVYPEEGLFFKLPQWILLLPVGILGFIGALKRG